MSTRTRNRDIIPTEQLSLVDPLGRRKGEDSHGYTNPGHGTQIPASSYAEIVQIPSAPQHSRALAIEICDAEQGVYEIRVDEHGNEPYVLDVTGRAPDTEDRYSLLLHHIANEGLMRRYRFIFKIDKGKATVRWLDGEGHEQMRIENNEW